MTDDRPVAPSLDDPVLTSLSESVGGPAGAHGRGHRWWSPVRVILAVTAVFFVLGMIQKAPCYTADWSNGEERFAKMCYSDMPYLYVGRGFAELSWPYDDDEQTRARYDVMEYPVGISYFAYGAAWITQAVHGLPDVVARGKLPVATLGADPDVVQERSDYVAVSAVLLGAIALLGAWLLARTHRSRPWDAMLFAAAPVLVLNGLINWDLLAVTLVAGALYAWTRDRPLLTGILIGLGTATKLYPLFLLGAILIICVRRREYAKFAVATAAAAASWLLANLPAMLTGWDEWKVFWSFNSERGADLGSVWLVLSQAGHTFEAGTINNVSWLFFIVWCVAVLAIGLMAPETPRMAQLGFLIVAGFLLINKVYSPQYVLWLLPLAVLARPRWRDQLIWQAGEVFYFAAVWWYLGGFLAPGSGDEPGFYWLAIGLRLICELYLIGIVVRDVLWPQFDVVREGRGLDGWPPRRGAGRGEPSAPATREPVGR